MILDRPCRISLKARQASSERMKGYWKDEEFRKMTAARAKRNMEYLNSKPEFLEKKREKMRKLNSNPEFQKKRLEGIKKIAAKSAEHLRKMQTDEGLRRKYLEGIRKYWNIPANNPISLLDKWQREEYERLRKGKLLPREESLRIALKDAPGLLKLILKLYEERAVRRLKKKQKQ